MVHNKYRISRKQAAAMGMLSSEAGLSAMARVLAAVPLPASVLGAVPQAYWKGLLQNAPGIPGMYAALDITPASAKTTGPISDATTAVSAAPSGPTVTKANLEATIVKIASTVLGVSDIDTTQPLALQGLDSLAGLELRQKLQEALGMDLALLADDPQGATVASIVAEAASKIKETGPILGGGRTLVVRVATNGGPRSGDIDDAEEGPKPVLWISPTPVAIKMRLYCLPWAGGVSENLFAKWSMMLPASIQVCPVEIPGRGRREGEPAISTVGELATMLAHSLPLQEKPYAFFGTCLGAIVSYEVIREVERTGCAPMPVAFMPAAVSPPHVYAEVVMKIYLQRRLSKLQSHCVAIYY